VQGKYWKMLVDMQLDEGDMQSAVATFGLCLTNCFTVELWKAYMRYIYTVCYCSFPVCLHQHDVIVVLQGHVGLVIDLMIWALLLNSTQYIAADPCHQFNLCRF
jgi:hypothetical protein